MSDKFAAEFCRNFSLIVEKYLEILMEAVCLKKLFMTLAFMCAMIFTATALAAWSSAYKDNLENEWHVETNTVKVDKKDDNTIEFHANFGKIFSEKGLKAEEENFKKSSKETFPKNIKMEMGCIHFKEEGGKIFTCITDSFCLDEKGEPIEGFGYVNKPIEWHAIKQDGVAYELYKIAKKYV